MIEEDIATKIDPEDSSAAGATEPPSPEAPAAPEVAAPEATADLIPAPVVGVLWGTIGHLTPDQAVALSDFTRQADERDLETVKFSVEAPQNACLRFLRARQFNVPKALLLLSECVQRKTAGKAAHFADLTPEECLHCDPTALKLWYPHTYLGYDKLRRPVLLEQSGMINPAVMAQLTSLPKLIDYHWHNMERVLSDMFEAQNEGAGAGAGAGAVISTCVILDLAGLHMGHCSSTMMDHVKALVAMDNACYPELLGKMLVINAPWLAVTSWEVVKRWLDPRTQAKIEILGSGPLVTKRLLEYIPTDVLPVQYGGSAPDPLNFKVQRPLTEFVHLQRGQSLKKTVTVPPQKVLYVDSYVTDGEVLLEVFALPLQTEAPEAGAEAGAGVPTTPPRQPATIPAAPAGTSGATLLKRLLLRRPESQKSPMRVVLDFANPLTQDMMVLVQWTNEVAYFSRPIAVNLFFAELDAHSPLPSTSDTQYY